MLVEKLVERYAVVSCFISGSYLSSLRVWSCIGAPFQIAPARTAAIYLPILQFYNSYAPTENCLVTTMHRLTRAELTSSDRLYQVPIGKPVPGWECFLYDDETNAVITPLDASAIDAGITRSIGGVCYVRGPGVLKAYLNRDDLTQAAFLSVHDRLELHQQDFDCLHNM
jgi:non-ribosomal peptide synthetase component F